MKTISLKKYGHFLSGRSLPLKIIADVSDSEELALDFAGVIGCNQSFLNELFQRIEAVGLKLRDVIIVGLENATIEKLVEAERSRFIQITSMPATSNG
jgi:hypothetical protein